MNSGALIFFENQEILKTIMYMSTFTSLLVKSIIPYIDTHNNF